MNLKALLEQKAKLAADRKALLDKIEARGNKFEGDEEAQLKAIKAEQASTDVLIAEAQADIAAANAAPVNGFGIASEKHKDTTALHNPEAASIEAMAAMTQMFQAIKQQSMTPSMRNRVDRIVASNPDAPFQTFGHYLQAVTAASKNRSTVSAETMNRLNAVGAYNGAAEAVDADGGFLVQSDFLTPMLDNIVETGVLSSKCARISTSNPSVVLPRLKDENRTDGNRNGGVEAYWTDEGDQIGKTKPKWERANVPVDKLAVLVPVTEELTQDAAAFGGWINTLGTNAMGFKVDDAIIRGSGAGAPLGILNSPALVTAAAESMQTADTVNYTNITKMMGRVRPGSKKGMIWLANQELYPQILTLKDDSDRNIFLQGQNIANLPVDRLLGREYQEQEQCSAPGDVGDLMAVDLSQYLLIDRSGVQVDVSMHFYFDTAENAIRMMLRLGGIPLPALPTTPYKGSLSLSPFVALAAR